MTTENLGLEQPTEEAPIEEQAAEEQPAEQATVEAEDDKVEGAVEFKPGEKYVPLSAVIEARRSAKEIKAERDSLKEQAAKAADLERWVTESRPYIDFIKANPHFLQQPQQPAAKPEPQDDPKLVAYAKRFDLYTADGKPDTGRAKEIIEENRQIAREEAQQVAAPLMEQTESQAVLSALQQLRDEKDGDNQPINPHAINTLAQELVASLGKDGARRFIASPQSYQILQNMAWGAHARIPKKQMPKAPEHAPLHSERAGGKGEDVTVSTQHLGKLGVTEERYKAAAKGYKPGQANVLGEG